MVVVSRKEVMKLSCLLRRWAMQHFSFLKQQTGEHFAVILVTSNPHSSKTCLRPFALPVSVVIFCGFPPRSACMLFIGMIVFFCFLCFPLFDLFMSNAWRASSPSEAWCYNPPNVLLLASPLAAPPLPSTQPTITITQSSPPVNLPNQYSHHVSRPTTVYGSSDAMTIYLRWR